MNIDLNCDIQNCRRNAIHIVDDHGVNTDLCEEHYQMFLAAEKTIKELLQQYEYRNV